MVDSELKELRELKAKKVQELSDKLQRLKNKKLRCSKIILESMLSGINEEPQCSMVESMSLEKDAGKLCDISQSVLGIQFENVDRDWISGDTYRYKAELTSKAIRFKFDLMVNIEKNGFTIEDINCHFVGLDQCYLQEIVPWIQRFTREKKFSYLISGIADYSDQSIVRVKILRALESKDYISIDKCQKECGGFYIYVHPPGDEDRVFFQFHWTTEFVDRSWRIEHIFEINPIEADETFVAANKHLLEGFCKIGLRKADLEDLWSQLCSTIDDVSK